MFSKTTLDEKRLVSAIENAGINWDWWEKDFLYTKYFRQMPVFLSYPRFRGFGADYSVFRGLKTDELEKIRQWFLKRSDPKDFKEIFEEFQDEFGNKPNRVSLISKLLCMWKPTKFAMWDSYARKGIKRLHESKRGHCYNNYSVEDYNTYNSDFFSLLSAVEEQLLSSIEKQPHFRGIKEDFAPRVLDVYLMLMEEDEQ